MEYERYLYFRLPPDSTTEGEPRVTVFQMAAIIGYYRNGISYNDISKITELPITVVIDMVYDYFKEIGQPLNQ